jgi:hypothetical protein
LVRSGKPHIAILTFNRLLKEFLATGSNNYPFEADRLQTFRSWGADLIRGCGKEIDTDGDFKEVRGRIAAGLEDLKDRVGDEVKYDCILVDEAQDYTVREIEAMRHFSNEMFAVGDDNQRIYENDGAIAHLATFCQEAPRLRYHYRNGLAICRTADGIMNDPDGSLLANSNYDEARYPSSVKPFSASGWADDQMVTAAWQRYYFSLVTIKLIRCCPPCFVHGLAPQLSRFKCQLACFVDARRNGQTPINRFEEESLKRRRH